MPTIKVRRALLFAGGCALAILLGSLIYMPGLPGDFVFDDFSSILGNTRLQLHSLAFRDLLGAAVSSPTGFLMRPLSMLSFALDSYFFGLAPASFKMTNVVIHIACGTVLTLVAYELLTAYATSTRRTTSAPCIAWMSLGIATLWLVHPLNLTAVLYTVQRETALASLFTAAATLAYIIGRRRQLELGKGEMLIWICVPLLGLLGMLCKENAALLPCYLLVTEICLLRFRNHRGVASRSIRLFYVVFLLLPSLAVIAYVAYHPARLMSGYAIRDYTMYERVLSEFRVLLDYLHWTLLPDLQQLGLFHDDIHPSRGLVEPASTLLSLVGIGLLLLLALGIRTRLPLLSLGILWFFAGQLMESTIAPLELAYEHRNYLPIFGLLFGVAGTLYFTAIEAGWTRWAVIVSAAVICALASTTAMRAAEWRSELSFAQFESRHHPTSPRALAELGWAYMQYILVTKDVSVIPQAVDAGEKSRAADPGSITQDIGLAYMFANLGELPAAKRHLDRAAEDARTAHPSASLLRALQTLLDLVVDKNRPLIADMNAILVNAAANPNLMRDDCDFSDIWNTLGLFRHRTNDIPGSLNALNKAVQLCPQNGQTHANYASVLLAYGETHYAEQQLDALRQLHDLRYGGILRELERQLDEAEKKRITGNDGSAVAPAGANH